MSISGTKAVVDWVVDYFTVCNKSGSSHANALDVLRGASPVVVTDKMPLVLQHNGHSQTIIGYEISKQGTNLLVFDPSR